MVRLNRTYYSLLKSTSKTVWYGLTVHLFSPLKNYKQNFQNYLSQSNSSQLRKFRAIRPHSLRITQNSHILLTYSILCFRHLLRQRTLKYSSELRCFDLRTQWYSYQSNRLTFRSLTIDREPRKIGANQQDSAQFAHLLRELREFRAFRSKLIHV